ncbi:hypothetical protein ABTZ99_23755 [Actinosynnema sp. NPDC002837]
MVDRTTVWIADARQAVDKASDVIRTRTEYDGLVEMGEEVDAAVRDLARIREAAELGLGEWLTGFDVPAVLWEELRAAQEGPSRRRLAAVVRTLGAFRTKGRNAIREAWRDHTRLLADRAVDVRNLMTAFPGSPELAELAAQMDNALGRLTRSQKDLPDAAAVAARRELERLLEEVDRLWPDAVKDFISAAARGGASLDMLTTEVLAWLVQNQATHSFKIVAGAPMGARRG